MSIYMNLTSPNLQKGRPAISTCHFFQQTRAAWKTTERDSVGSGLSQRNYEVWVHGLVKLQIWLVVSIPLKNTKVNWDDDSQYMEK